MDATLSTATLHYGAMIVGLLGGLALFLFGMDQLTVALKEAAGGHMKALLARMTKNRFRAILAGAFTTAVIQSSSVTTVLTVGFVQSGLMSLQQAIGVVMGASIGTTVTAQIIAFKVTNAALVAIAAGFLAYSVAKTGRVRRYGTMLLGLGLVFLGMNVMGEAMAPLRGWPPFIEAMSTYSGPLPAVLVGAAFTALVQSSSATTGIIIVLASQGMIPLETGLALALGANLGTTVTALLAAIGKRAEAVQTALAYFIFKLVSSVAWLMLLLPLAEAMRMISPAHAELEGLARLAAETPRQIANGFMALNVLNAVVFVWFSGPLAMLVQRLYPGRPEPISAVAQPRYLDEALLDTPDLALDRVRMEMGHLAETLLRLLGRGPSLVFDGTTEKIDEIPRLDSDVDNLHDAIIGYLGRLSRRPLSAAQSELLHDYMAAAGYFESMGDLVEMNLTHAARIRLSADLAVSPATRQVVGDLWDKVFWAVGQAARAVASSSAEAAEAVIASKAEVKRLATRAELHLARRVSAPEAHRMALFRIESDFVEAAKRIHYFARRIAKRMVETDMPEHDASGRAGEP
ncbi:MAG: Na/Pi cotransporter family protein [Gammaproteobacteria bacterium]